VIRQKPVHSKNESSFGTYSVVDLLQRPSIAGEYIPKHNRARVIKYFLKYL